MDVEGSNPFSRSTIATGLFAVALMLVAVRSDAQTCAVPKNASAKLASVPASERLELIRATLD